MLIADRQRVTDAVYRAVAELNAQLAREARLTLDPSTRLVGALSSLHLVVLIVAAEQKLEEEFGVSIPLATDDVADQARTPFLSLQTLIDHAIACATECMHG